MREVKFILPCRTSAPSTDPEHQFVRKALIDTFGGFTAYNSKGGWRNSRGENIVERGITYVVAIIQFDGLGNFARFREIALQAGRMAEQEAVYIVGPTGDAEIVSLVNIGKEIIRGEVRAERSTRDLHAGDLYETRDGARVYIDGQNHSTGYWSVRVIKQGSTDSGRTYLVDGRGYFVSVAVVGPDDAQSPHPLSLKRFIGR